MKDFPWERALNVIIDPDAAADTGLNLIPVAVLIELRKPIATSLSASPVWIAYW